MFDSFINKHKLTDAFSNVATSEFVPLAEKIVSKKKQQKTPFIVGINGCQGSGKSTLAEFLAEYIKDRYSLNVIVLSLDDFYYSQQQRAALATDIHPLLATRGVPGTHNTAHIGQLMEALKKGEGTLSLPRFNKATDNPFPEENWPMIDLPVDIVLFEGWCWGGTPQSKQQLETPVNQLEQDADAKGTWRSYVNSCLLRDYLPLYTYMDFWIFLKAPSFDCVYQWRLEQEKKLRLKSDLRESSKIMSETEVMAFIQFYQRLTEHSLATMADLCEVVFFLDSQRRIVHTLVQDRVAEDE